MIPSPESAPRRRTGRLLEIGASLALAAVLVYAGVVRRTHDTGLVRVADDQVAVIVDRSSGTSRVVQRPGYLPFVPLLEKVHLFDKSPRMLRMEGSRPDGQERVPRLIARAKDGSSLWFHEVVLQYALIPESAAAALDECGPGSVGRPSLLEPAARAILRDEVARFTAEEIARGECSQPVVRAAVAGLNEVLRPHGIEVLGLSLGKPGFDDSYEDAIRRRGGFAQEAAELEAKLQKLAQERRQKEAALRGAKRVEAGRLEGTSIEALGAARREDVRARQEADDASRAQLAGGRASKLEKETQAALEKARNVAAARDVYREGLELEKAGDLPVRAAIVRKLAGIQFDLLPYSRDPAPYRIEYENPPAGAARGARP